MTTPPANFVEMSNEPVIEKGVPIPTRFRSGKWVPLLQSMEAGDSFVVHEQVLRDGVLMTAKRLGLAVTSRKLHNAGGWRIWRTTVNSDPTTCSPHGLI